MAMSNIDKFIAFHGRKFSLNNLPTVEGKLRELDDSQVTFLSSQDYRDPKSALYFLLGCFGGDRFILAMNTDNQVFKYRQIKIGVVKLDRKSVV